ncbi:MAG TPA: type II toxin-antitoxin system HicA family toxin [Nitrospira sp.]|nr:type II toxin-antitoxin system HicA family toxin [Nitrospira sp.]
MNKQKLLAKALAGSKNLRFTEAVALAKAFGYRLARTKGSHRIFVHPKIKELINLQEVGGKAKPYQVRQLLDVVERYNLRLELEDEP